MQRLILEGGTPLSGEIPVQGAKNSALPVLAATILCNSQCVIHNCPSLSDVDSSCRILAYLGCKIHRQNGTVVVDAQNVSRTDVPDDLMREMRSSIVFLGSIAARTGQARISFPGGCELGPRPIDLHLSSLRQLGLQISEDHGWLDCTAPKRLRGAAVALSFPSVGATENIMLAASTASGVTTVVNAAREPEISDLADFLNRCGAKISGAGESVIRIEGVPSLHGCEFTVIPDRIVAATYMAAAGITGGDVTLQRVRPDHLAPVIPLFEETGCRITAGGDRLRIRAGSSLRCARSVRTMPYPGFPTDAQAPFMAMSSVASGTGIFIENIFENRYKHVPELIRMGARIKIEGRVAVVEGVERLYGAAVEACDLRGGAALAVAGLRAEGTTELRGLQYIDRGYEHIERDFSRLGARVRRVESPPGG